MLKFFYIIIAFILLALFSPLAFAAKTDKVNVGFVISGDYLPEECLLSKENQIFIRANGKIFNQIFNLKDKQSVVNTSSDSVTVTYASNKISFSSKDKNSVIQIREKRNRVLYINLRNLVDSIEFSYIFDYGKMTCNIFPLVTQITENNGVISFSLSGRSSTSQAVSEKLGSKSIIKIKGCGVSQNVKIPQGVICQGASIEQFDHDTAIAVLTINNPTAKEAQVLPSINENIISFSLDAKEMASVQAPVSPVLNVPEISAQTPVLPATELKDIEISSDDKTVTFTFITTSSFSYKWSRFKDPDNRFIFDIPACKMSLANKELNIQHSLAKGVRIAQFEPGPEGATRVVIDLLSPSSCDIIKNSDTSVSLKFGARLQSPYSLKLAGYGTTATNNMIKGDGSIICIDPGHGGGDSGACNRTLGLAEKDITLNISQRLATILRARGYEVIMTRETDRDVSYAGSPDSEELNARVNIGKKADIFISVHINASNNKNANGVSTHWYKAEDKNLAVEIQQSLASRTERNDRGAVRDNFYVVSKSSVPAVLVEAGFISNNEEAKLLMQDDFLQKVAESIADGLGIYISKYGNGRIATSKRAASSK